MSRASLSREAESHWEDQQHMSNVWLMILIQHGTDHDKRLATALLAARDVIGESREMLEPIIERLSSLPERPDEVEQLNRLLENLAGVTWT